MKGGKYKNSGGKYKNSVRYSYLCLPIELRERFDILATISYHLRCVACVVVQFYPWFILIIISVTTT